MVARPLYFYKGDLEEHVTGPNGCSADTLWQFVIRVANEFGMCKIKGLQIGASMALAPH